MMERKEILKNILIIFCAIILFAIPWASVFGIQDPGLLDAASVFQHTAAFVLITAMVLRLIYQIYGKPLTQEMKEEEIKEADQQEKKQLLFKPTIGFSVMYLFFVSLCVFPIISQFTDDKANIGLTIGSIGVIILIIWFWYMMPVFIFTEDSVQIKSHLFYLLGIDRKTIFRYVDITSVSPNMKIEGNAWGVEPKHSIVISTNEITQAYVLKCYNPDIIAKIYLRFKEKLGDKVKLE